MEHFEKTIRLANAQGQMQTAELVCTTDDEGDCSIALTCEGCNVAAKAADFFEALCRIRVALEQYRLTPQCYGASRNVYPSGMARDMGQGLRAYRLKLGRHARELVDIFEDGPGIDPVSVDVQKAFFEMWLTVPRVL